MLKLISLILLLSSLSLAQMILVNPRRAAVINPPATGITFVTSSPTTNTAAPGRTNNGTITITLPSGWSAGQVAIIVIYVDQGDASTPTNWTEITGSPFANEGNERFLVFWKTLWTGEPDPVTTISGSALGMSSCAGVMVYSNVDTTTAISVIGGVGYATGSPMSAGAITTTSANQVVIGLCGRGDNESSDTQTFGGSATGVNERLDAGTNAGNDSQVSAYDKTIATTSTSSGDGSAATSADDPWLSVIIGLKLK